MPRHWQSYNPNQVDPPPDAFVDINGRFACWLNDGEDDVTNFWGTLKTVSIRLASPDATWVNAGLCGTRDYEKYPVEVRIEMLEESNYCSDLRLSISRKDAIRTADLLRRFAETA
jgi:hypothetical protein